MVALASIRVLVFPIIAINAFLNPNRDVENKDFSATCDKVTLDPYFENAMVVGVKWRVYYIWSKDMDNICIDVVFKYAHSWMVDHIRHNMRRYLVSQPDWDKASLYLSFPEWGRQMLLIPDENGIPGRFIQVPFAIKDYTYTRPHKGQIPLSKMSMKLYLQGTYLVISDCSAGFTVLLANRTRKPVTKVMNAVILASQLGEGLPICMN